MMQQDYHGCMSNVVVDHSNDIPVFLLMLFVLFIIIYLGSERK